MASRAISSGIEKRWRMGKERTVKLKGCVNCEILTLSLLKNSDGDGDGELLKNGDVDRLFKFPSTRSKALLELYKKLSGSIIDDGVIHKEELQQALLRKAVGKNLFLDRAVDSFFRLAGSCWFEVVDVADDTSNEEAMEINILQTSIANQMARDYNMPEI
ncbi:uncharacterized protein LOC104447416 [Eucalyptus grandis]|uniref:uncharacterized protein LOC104447416 n=1 Tax=Eucalyptus grandis TaxID=71139 RepID=UPI00192ED3AC|nr:uncharacterized protein LOC104447416 [Eucalyptus grandis]